METRLNRKGQADLAVTIVTTAIIVAIVVIVLSELLPIGGTAVGGAAANTTTAYATWSNVSNYAYTGTTLAAIGIVVVAGFGLIGLLVMRK